MSGKGNASQQSLPTFDIEDQDTIKLNFYRIKQDVEDIANEVMETILNDPAKEHLLIKK